MPGTTATPTILTDPGYLFWAPLATSIPTNTVAGSVFTDSWAGPWISLGATEDGSQFDYELSVEAITVAEFLDPIKYVTTGRTGSFAFNLASYTLSNLAKALNGSAPTVVSGSGATTLSRVRPPVAGQEVRAMIGWESLDNTMRAIFYQTLNSGRITTAYKKAPSFAVIPTSWNFEMPVSGIPWEFYGAGTARG
jgi:hypothetical protein